MNNFTVKDEVKDASPNEDEYFRWVVVNARGNIICRTASKGMALRIADIFNRNVGRS